MYRLHPVFCTKKEHQINFINSSSMREFVIIFKILRRSSLKLSDKEIKNIALLRGLEL